MTSLITGIISIHSIFIFQVFAWTIAILSIVASGFFVILYSMEWGSDKSNSWLSSFCLSWAESFFIFDTCKVCLHAQDHLGDNHNNRKWQGVRWDSYLQVCQWGFNMGKIKCFQIPCPLVCYKARTKVLPHIGNIWTGPWAIFPPYLDSTIVIEICLSNFSIWLPTRTHKFF